MLRDVNREPADTWTFPFENPPPFMRPTQRTRRLSPSVCQQMNSPVSPGSDATRLPRLGVSPAGPRLVCRRPARERQGRSEARRGAPASLARPCWPRYKPRAPRAAWARPSEAGPIARPERRRPIGRQRRAGGRGCRPALSRRDSLQKAGYVVGQIGTSAHTPILLPASRSKQGPHAAVRRAPHSGKLTENCS